MKKLTTVALLSLLFVVASGSDGCGNSPTAPRSDLPSAFFTFNAIDTGRSFDVSFDNQSRTANGSPVVTDNNTSCFWQFESKGTSNACSPSNRTWSYAELGLNFAGDSATRLVTLGVVENNDETRRADHPETLIFVYPTKVSGSGIVAVLVRNPWGGLSDNGKVISRAHFGRIIVLRGSTWSLVHLED